MCATANASATRADTLETLARVGREHSDATVLFHSTVAERLGLHPTDYKVLGMLQRTGPATAGEIARASGLAPASITNLIDRLVWKGFVRRAEDPDDRRRVLVEPTKVLLKQAQTLFASTQRSLARMWERYSDHELAIIADFLAANADRLRQETERLSAPGKDA